MGWQLSNLFNTKKEQGIDFSSALVGEKMKLITARYSLNMLLPRDLTLFSWVTWNVFMGRSGQCVHLRNTDDQVCFDDRKRTS